MVLVPSSYGRGRRLFSVLISSSLQPANQPLTIELIGQLQLNKDASQLIPALTMLESEGHVWLVSINFSRTVHGRLLASTKFRHSIQQRINNWLPRVGATRFVFVLEQALDRWHLHGVVAYPQDGAQELYLTLKRIAGETRNAFANGKLVHIQPVDRNKRFGGQSGIAGWAMYIGKRLTQSSAALKRIDRVTKASPVMASRPVKADLNTEHWNDPAWGIF